MIPVMIDSGAFSAWRKKEAIDLQAYIAYIHEILAVAKGHDVLPVNLDVIGDAPASYANWLEMRKQGLNPLPVFHATTDTDYLKKYLHHTNYIGLGAVARMGDARRKVLLDSLWRRFLTNSSSLPTVKVHGMGVTSFTLMRRYPWHSVDSVSWLTPSVFGHLYVAQRVAGKWRFDLLPYTRDMSNKSGFRGKKGKHIETVGPKQRAQLQEYLDFIQIPYGKSRYEKGEEVVVEPGVCNDRILRAHMNFIFFARFANTLPWPRPMGAGDRPSLFNGLRVSNIDKTATGRPNTLMYFGGEGEGAEHFITKDYPNAGVLFSYYTLQNKQATHKRLRRILHQGK